MGDKAPAWRPSEILTRKLEGIRNRKGWTQQHLADRLEELGEPTDRTTITKIENGTRRLPLDMALLLAAALGVSPVHLFATPPTEVDPRLQVRLSDRLVVAPRAARMWIRGQQPLPGTDPRTFYNEVSEEEYVAMQEYGIRLLLGLVQDLVDAVVDFHHAKLGAEADGTDAAAEVERQSTRVVASIDAINKELDRQRSAAERMRRR
jgi:transcriptional regulator with XRE-family HTH domain